MERHPTLNPSEDQIEMTELLMQREPYRSITEVYVSFLGTGRFRSNPT